MQGSSVVGRQLSIPIGPDRFVVFGGQYKETPAGSTDGTVTAILADSPPRVKRVEMGTGPPGLDNPSTVRIWPVGGGAKIKPIKVYEEEIRWKGDDAHGPEEVRYDWVLVFTCEDVHDSYFCIRLSRPMWAGVEFYNDVRLIGETEHVLSMSKRIIGPEDASSQIPVPAS